MQLIPVVLLAVAIAAVNGESQRHSDVQQIQRVGVAYLIPIFQPIRQENNENIDEQENELDTHNDVQILPLHALLIGLAVPRSETYENIYNKEATFENSVHRQKRSPAPGGGGGGGRGGGGGGGRGSSGSWSQSSSSSSSGSWGSGSGGGRGGGIGKGKGHGRK